MAKTLRLHILAKELGVTSKQVIEKCRAEGVELKNHMAAIPLGLAESIREWFSGHDDVTSIEVAERVDIATIREAAQKKAQVQVIEPSAIPEAPAAEGEPAAGEIALDIESDFVPEVAAAQPASEAPVPSISEFAAEPEPSSIAALAPEPITATLPEAVEPEPPPAEPPEVTPTIPEEALPTVGAEGPTTVAPPRPAPIMPAGPKLVPRPAELRGPRVVRIEAPEPLRPLRSRPAAQSASGGPGLTRDAAPAVGVGRRARSKTREKEEESESSKLRSRSPRRSGRTVDVGDKIQEWGEQDLQERRERLASATGHGLKERRAAELRRQAAAAASSTPAARKAPIEIFTPIALKDFCAAVGAPFATVHKKLVEHTGRLWTINESLDAEAADLVALDLGVSVAIAKQKTALELLREEFERRERTHLLPRPPVVAMLGHVDHGKTSLLDAIRHTAVAAGESGGITQHIGAYRIERDGWRVTFLDTPGHAAFTAMRARGANLTDVVVLVVAADDGVMPQTVEALNHAKAAGVQIVVALNKMDLPNIDLNRIYAQLAEHDLTPSEWGGHTDVIKTSATTGEGIDDLIAHLSTLSELMNLQADPTVPVRGTVIEAQMREGRGVGAQVLVREGTLRPGQFIVCGGSAGRVRMLRDDRGQTVKEAFPGWPVEIAGLDALPQTGDQLYEVDDLKQAKEIAEEVRQRRHSEALELRQKPRTLEALLAGGDASQVPELNVILKADVQGSVDVLKKALGDFPSNKAQLRIKHAGVGAISESDVQLARTDSAIIIGFCVVAEERARQLADQLGVEIRPYRVIYEILDDMHKALAGLLEPIRREEVCGTAEVRQVFNITRLGTVAGCYVTSGLLARNHKMRLVRDGRVVLDGASVHSLKRVKDDAREVPKGMECGVKLENFDDIKPGDVIEAYEIVEELQEL